MNAERAPPFYTIASMSMRECNKVRDERERANEEEISVRKRGRAREGEKDKNVRE